MGVRNKQFNEDIYVINNGLNIMSHLKKKNGTCLPQAGADLTDRADLPAAGRFKNGFESRPKRDNFQTVTSQPSCRR